MGTVDWEDVLDCEDPLDCADAVATPTVASAAALTTAAPRRRREVKDMSINFSSSFGHYVLKSRYTAGTLLCGAE